MSARLPALYINPMHCRSQQAKTIALQDANHLGRFEDADPPHLVTVPYHKRDLKPKTLRSIIRQAGWTVEDFLKRI